jgi:hypothetical protein
MKRNLNRFSREKEYKVEKAIASKTDGGQVFGISVTEVVV